MKQHCLLSFFRLFATPRTVARQASLPMDFPGKNAGVCCHFLLQGIFLAQESNLSLLHRQVDSLPLSHLGSSGNNISNNLFLWVGDKHT